MRYVIIFSIFSFLSLSLSPSLQRLYYRLVAYAKVKITAIFIFLLSFYLSLRFLFFLTSLANQSQITQPEVKALLPANTDRAFKAGAFGLPWFECTNAAGEQQGFWGIDHLGQVVDFLGLERGKEAGFKALL